jgi:predicted enzyme related to lactoylglutathione lyase
MTPDNSKGRILGIGGVFFKSTNHETLRDWYLTKLGIANDCMFPAGDHPTVWSIFPAASPYFGSDSAQFMINYVVDDLDAFLEKCKTKDVRIDEKREDFDYGRFAWIYDPDGNKIELWQPNSTLQNE